MRTVNYYIHFIEIWHFCDIHQINNGKVLDFLCDIIENFVHLHTHWIPIVPKANHLERETVFSRCEF